MKRGAAGGGRSAALALTLACALRVGVVPAIAAGIATEGNAPPPVDAVVVAAADDDGDADGVTVTVTRGPAGLDLTGRCLVRAPVSVAWEVLTDYDGISRFVSSMRESRVSGRGDRHVLVEQVAVGRLLLFRKKLRATLFVEETAPTRILFEDVLGRDFDDYRGEWRIEERPGGVEIVYQVNARPSFSVPDFIARGLFRRTARELLSQVRTEIERRAKEER